MKDRNKLHNWIPFEIKKAIIDCKCPTCNESLDTKRVNLIGIKQHSEGQVVLHLECTCRCGKKLEISLKKKKSVEQLCYMILEEIEKDRRIETVRRRFPREFAEMKESEVTSFLKDLRKVKFHEDFMKLIGSEEYVEDQESHANESKD